MRRYVNNCVQWDLFISPLISWLGGDHHFRPEFWQALRDTANKYEILLIADEVQAGMGLTGKFWSWQHYGAVPDIMCFGKKAQICGIMATSRLDEVKDNVFALPSRINSTWGGSLVDMVRSRRLLEIIEEEKLVENSCEVGKYLLGRLVELHERHPTVIFNVRGKGLLCSFDLPTPAHCDQLRKLCYERGCLIISCGTKHDSIRLRPGLVRLHHLLRPIKFCLLTTNWLPSLPPTGRKEGGY